MNIVTYHSSNAKPNEAWLAYPVLPSGEQWLVRSTGATEQEAVAKAAALWEREQKKYQITKSGSVECPYCKWGFAPNVIKQHIREKHNELVDSDPSQLSGGSPHAGRHHFVGKVWVINRATHDLKRIDPNELASYEANGYVRGGPRSK